MADETTTPAPTVKAPEHPEPSAPAPSGVPLQPVTPPLPDTGYTPDGVPTLEGVREKIETRYATALGATELAQDLPEVRDAAERYDTTQKAAAEKLDEIRAAMHKKAPETPAT